jgi:hypothetical protein
MLYDLMISHPMNVGNYNIGWGKALEEKNDEFLNSICEYFNERLKNEPVSYENSVWYSNVERQKSIIDALINKDLNYLHDTLKNLFSSPLTHGTAQGDEHYNMLVDNTDVQKQYAQVYYDKLITLMEMNSIIPIFSPEEYYYVKRFDKYFNISPEAFLKELSTRFEFDVSAPKYSGNLFGLDTKYGLYNERDFMSLGVALMVKERFDDKNINICEIGGGVGHLAFYLHRLGYKNISIVDLPTISVSQMYFLSVNLDDNNVQLISPQQFTGKYDLVLNVDSMTEMNIESAKEYCDKMENETQNFISINHETNPFTVNQICNMRRISRHPFWLRKGYVFEEYRG